MSRTRRRDIVSSFRVVVSRFVRDVVTPPLGVAVLLPFLCVTRQ
jgi:hypothetical protein